MCNSTCNHNDTSTATTSNEVEIETACPDSPEDTNLITYTCSDCDVEETVEEEGPLPEDWITTSNNDTVCSSCREDYVYLTDDDMYVHVDDAVYVESRGEYFHARDSHIRWSAVDQAHVHTSDAVLTEHDGWVSQNTYEESYFSCDSCSEVLDNDRYAADGCCDHCYEEEDDEDGGGRWVDGSPLILDYDDDVLRYIKAVPVPATEKRRYSLGMELEVESIRHEARALLEKKGELMRLKNDGSLNKGFEIVTAPMPYSTMVNDMWTSEFLAYLSDNGGRSFNTDTCGLHIHVGREWLSKLQISKAVIFMNNPDNWGFISTVAMRDPSRWATRRDKTYSPCLVREGDKYSAINTGKGPTIEFRIFKGTLARAGVLRALQFVTTLLDHMGRGGKDTASMKDAHKLKPYLEYLCREWRANKELVDKLMVKGFLRGSAETGYVVVESACEQGEYTPVVQGRKSRATQDRLLREQCEAEIARGRAAADEALQSWEAGRDARHAELQAALARADVIPSGRVAMVVAQELAECEGGLAGLGGLRLGPMGEYYSDCPMGTLMPDTVDVPLARMLEYRRDVGNWAPQLDSEREFREYAAGFYTEVALGGTMWYDTFPITPTSSSWETALAHRLADDAPASSIIRRLRERMTVATEYQPYGTVALRFENPRTAEVVRTCVMVAAFVAIGVSELDRSELSAIARAGAEAVRERGTTVTINPRASAEMLYNTMTSRHLAQSAMAAWVEAQNNSASPLNSSVTASMWDYMVHRERT